MAAEELPAELEDQCSECHKALAGIERLLKPLVTMNKAHIEDKLEEVDDASKVLLLTYTMNSLFWVYLAVNGVNPKSHRIKQELERVQKVMKRARNIDKGKKEPGVLVDSSAAKRFIRSALWEEKEKDKDQNNKGGKRKRIKLDNDAETPK